MPRHRRGAFTLLETLISISIIALLLSIGATSLRVAMASARGVACQSTLRDIAIDFQHFADFSQYEDRGEDSRLQNRFRLATFQDKQYGVDEYWHWGDEQVVTLPDKSGADPMRCAAVQGDVTLRRGIECVDGAVTPAQRVSYGFNRRLHRAEVTDNRGRPRTVQVFLTPDILTHPNVPLVWDVDGYQAERHNTYPGFSAPSLDSMGAYANDRFWFPGVRHAGVMNIAFMDTHVESVKDPLARSGWAWAYQPVK